MGVVCVVIPHFTLVLRRSANRELDVIFEGVLCVCVRVCVWCVGVGVGGWVCPPIACCVLHVFSSNRRCTMKEWQRATTQHFSSTATLNCKTRPNWRSLLGLAPPTPTTCLSAMMLFGWSVLS